MSRLPSSRSSSAASSGRSSPAAAARAPRRLGQSPKSDVYVAMLGIIAARAIIIACLLMTILFSKYSFSTKVSGLMAPSQAATLA